MLSLVICDSTINHDENMNESLLLASVLRIALSIVAERIVEQKRK